MTRKSIDVRQSLSRAERIKVTLGTAALGALATTAVVGGIAHEASQPDTYPQQVTVEFGDKTPTIDDAAHQLRQQGATENLGELRQELIAAEPGHDGVVHDGDRATVHIDVPVNEGDPGEPR